MSDPFELSLAYEDPPLRERAVAGAMAADRRKVLVIGLFPPPIDGQRVVTQRMFEEIDGATVAARYNLDAFRQLGPLSKPLSVLAATLLLPLARLKGYTAVYLAPHSGTGLLFSGLLALVSRCCGYGLFVHYHSFRNIGRRSSLMARFLACCGPEAVHVVLAPPMAWGLRHFYPSIRHVAVVSNSVFVPPRAIPRCFDGRRIRIGHLSNLSRDKGIDIVLACVQRLIAQGLDVELHLAGPATDNATGALISAAAAEFGDRLRYRGPLARSEVRRFYDEIDIFLFPTLHEHEAEPLVIIDAVAAGVPVIATNRGCIGYLLHGGGGRSFDAFDFVERAAEQIALWVRDRAALAAASAGAISRFEALHAASRGDLETLLGSILERPGHR